MPTDKMSEKPQIQIKHPQEYIDDLNPDKGASQNLGEYVVSADPNHQTAADNKDLVRMFKHMFTMDELQQLPIVPHGAPLKQGAVYLDLANRDGGAFTVHGPTFVRTDQFFTPKSEVPYELWNRLTKEFNS